MNKTIFILFIALICSHSIWGQEIEQQREGSTGPEIYHIEVRVIFADQTGIHGHVPRELIDMRRILTKRWDYPSYTLNNTIHLSLFDDEEVVAMVFPEHFLRLIPKGSASNGLKLKAELYHAESERQLKTKVYAGRLDDSVEPQFDDPENPDSDVPQRFSLPRASVEEKRKEGQHSTTFPIISSAILANEDDWEAFGGVPVFVNSQNVVQSNRLSTSSLGGRLSGQTRGDRKNLLLGIKLAEE